MKERPIIFSGEMVRAILDGRKTQTRRVVGGTALRMLADGFTPKYVADPGNSAWCPYGAIGDRLWVKETFLPVVDGDPPGWYEYEGKGPDEMGYDGPDAILYKATDDHYPKKWRNALCMPRWASRITLEIVAVRVERVQDISEEDAKAEGMTFSERVGFWVSPAGNCIDARLAYRYLWDSINGKPKYVKGAGFGGATEKFESDRTWAKNPWVWVIEFKPIGG